MENVTKQYKCKPTHVLFRPSLCDLGNSSPTRSLERVWPSHEPLVESPGSQCQGASWLCWSLTAISPILQTAVNAEFWIPCGNANSILSDGLASANIRTGLVMLPRGIYLFNILNLSTTRSFQKVLNFHPLQSLFLSSFLWFFSGMKKLKMIANGHIWNIPFVHPVAYTSWHI